MDFPNKKYRLIYADPPWNYNDKAKAGNRGASSKYDCMDIDKICNLPVESISDDSSLLVMWHVPTMPEEALRVCRSWGFRFVTMKGLTYAKRAKNGNWKLGMGHYTRANTEDALIGIRGKTRDIVKDKGVIQIIEEDYHRHSQKPEQAYEKLEKLCGDVSRIELFARKKRVGWDSWGNEI